MKFFSQPTYDTQPQIDASVLVCDDARILGDVSVGRYSSIWYGAILRADFGSIRIGEASNVQEHVLIHMSRGTSVTIGDRVSIGHGAKLHGCHIEDDCIIGMGSLVMNNVVIGRNSIVAAGTTVHKGVFPPNSLIVGGKVVRSTTQADWDKIRINANEYRELVLRSLPSLDFGCSSVFAGDSPETADLMAIAA